MAKINEDVKNSRVSYKDRDIVLDYEFKLHAYDNKSDLKNKGLIPVEMYPYNDDIIVGYIPVDARFGVIKLEELYKWIKDVLKEENNNKENDMTKDNIITLDIARKMYNSNDKDLKNLALSLYSEFKLKGIPTLLEIMVNIDTKDVESVANKMSNIDNIFLVAKYLNKNWTPKAGEIKYFWVNINGIMSLQKHVNAYYPYIPYFRTPELAEIALHIVPQEFHNLLEKQ